MIIPKAATEAVEQAEKARELLQAVDVLEGHMSSGEADLANGLRDALRATSTLYAGWTEAQRKAEEIAGANLDLNSEMQRLRDELAEAERKLEAAERALKPFAKAYGRSSKLVHGTRGMSEAAKNHNISLLSAESDGHFGYLPIKAFKAAADAILGTE